jgi:hypothetical protein
VHCSELTLQQSQHAIRLNRGERNFISSHVHIKELQYQQQFKYNYDNKTVEFGEAISASLRL